MNQYLFCVYILLVAQDEKLRINAAIISGGYYFHERVVREWKNVESTVLLKWRGMPHIYL